MLTEEQLISQYQTQGMLRGKNVYFQLSTARKFVADCQKNNLAVIGVEGFRLIDEKYIQPDLKLIADFSSPSGKNWKEFRDSCNVESRKFLREIERLNESIWLDFTILPEHEWTSE